MSHLVASAVIHVAAFPATTALPDARTIGGHAGLGRTRPVLGGALIVALLGPMDRAPSGVFVDKLLAAAGGWDAGVQLTAVLLVNDSPVSLFCSLRWSTPVLQRGQPRVAPRRWSGRWRWPGRGPHSSPGSWPARWGAP